MAAWWKEEVDAARHRQEKSEKSSETGKLVIADGTVEFCEATPIGLVDNPCTDARPTKTCVVPVDASRDFIYFFGTSSQCGGWGGGDMLPDFSFCSLFPVQQTTSGIGYRVKYFFRVGNQYAECEKQQQQHTYMHTTV